MVAGSIDNVAADMRVMKCGIINLIFNNGLQAKSAFHLKYEKRQKMPEMKEFELWVSKAKD